MSEKFIKKNIKLSLEFDSYLSKHRAAFKKIPNKACIVITVKGDEKFNRDSKAIAERVKGGKQKCVEARKEGRAWILQPLLSA